MSDLKRIKKRCSIERVIIETLRYSEIGARVTGSNMFFSFYDDDIDLMPVDSAVFPG